MRQIPTLSQPTFACANLEVTIEQVEAHGIHMFERGRRRLVGRAGSLARPNNVGSPAAVAGLN
jgi:hypothetical protein